MGAHLGDAHDIGEFQKAMDRINKSTLKKTATTSAEKEIVKLKRIINQMEKQDAEAADPKFKARLREHASFNQSTIMHFEVAYNLTKAKITYMTLSGFKRLVRHNGPIAVTMSNGVMLIGHPYDF
jgi:hypothetical protein